MMILAGNKRSLVGYHASLWPLKKLTDVKPFHIGSEKQAIAYGKMWREQEMMGGTEARRGNLFLYKVTVPVNRKRVLLSTMKRATLALTGRYKRSKWMNKYNKGVFASQMRLSKGKRFLDESVDYNRLDPYLNFEGDPRMLKPDHPAYPRLRKRYDILPYKNRVEGHGLSVALLHPSRAKIKLVRRWT
jgi:hypothetical protein